MNNYMVMVKEDQIYNISIIENELILRSDKNDNGGWEKEIKIDKDVNSFAIDVDERNRTHIAYINDEGIQYCYIKNGEVNKDLIDKKNIGFTINNPQIYFDKDAINIFCSINQGIHNETTAIIHYEVADEGINKKEICKMPTEAYKGYDVIKNGKSITAIYSVKDAEGFKYRTYSDKEWGKEKLFELEAHQTLDFSIEHYKNGYLLTRTIKEQDINFINAKVLDKSFKVQSQWSYSSIKDINRVKALIGNRDTWLMWEEDGHILGSDIENDTKAPRLVYADSSLVQDSTLITFEENKMCKKKLFFQENDAKIILPYEVIKDRDLQVETEYYKTKENIILGLINKLKEIDSKVDERIQNLQDELNNNKLIKLQENNRIKELEEELAVNVEMKIKNELIKSEERLKHKILQEKYELEKWEKEQTETALSKKEELFKLEKDLVQKLLGEKGELEVLLSEENKSKQQILQKKEELEDLLNNEKELKQKLEGEREAILQRERQLRQREAIDKNNIKRAEQQRAKEYQSKIDTLNNRVNEESSAKKQLEENIAKLEDLIAIKDEIIKKLEQNEDSKRELEYELEERKDLIIKKDILIKELEEKVVYKDSEIEKLQSTVETLKENGKGLLTKLFGK